MKFMKKLIVLLGILFLGYGVYAQDYGTAIGLRGGETQGITLKQFVGGSSAFDFILGTHHYGLNFTALYEIHSLDVFGVDNLALFYGFGGHVGLYSAGNYPSYWSDYSGSATLIGIDGVVGVEYTFDEIPISLSLDIVPSINILPYLGYWQRGALSIRYVLK